ncbi:histidinol-phosphate aminotransferase [Piptocephalis cylindrospora]|uniref:histidinol-phosphate transaminase n=1 Tax=Piptocephalis cylindrospora TaxID=1907219 RepID=A0A4P9Y7E4_9FUNG|nr:histidinol-phosphate aminotransferase [Piptocephalis cylindrospora]|eukprot:RKP14732.1 histidinol-phosphate aminotransferase [Piptocephalis cylindrospora]
MLPETALDTIVRPNIKALTPYRCARDDYSKGVLLDANENAFGSAVHREGQWHRYPDPVHDRIRDRYAALRGVKGTQVVLGNGSDEPIDLLQRVFCTPASDAILVCPPTYGMYSVCAQVNDLAVVQVPLNVHPGHPDHFQLNVPEILKALDNKEGPRVRLVYLCSPGNPTGEALRLSDIQALLDANREVIYVIDEAYIDFLQSREEDGGRGSGVRFIREGHPNVVVLQTLSKGFGLAGIRLGLAMASEPLIQYLLNAKYPYNIAGPTADIAHDALAPEALDGMRNGVSKLLEQRELLVNRLRDMSSQGIGRFLGGRDANFILVEVLSRDSSGPDPARALAIYTWMAERSQIVVRYRGSLPQCLGALRITVGTPEEMEECCARLSQALTLSDEELRA